MVDQKFASSINIIIYINRQKGLITEINTHYYEGYFLIAYQSYWYERVKQF